MTFNAFYNILQDSFNDMAGKLVDDISLTREDIKYIKILLGVNNLLIFGGSTEKKTLFLLLKHFHGNMLLLMKVPLQQSIYLY